MLGEVSEKKKDAMTLTIGNLLPGQAAVLKLTLIEEVTVSGSAFAYTLPTSFFPDYSKHSCASGAEPQIDYKLSYNFTIEAGSKIKFLSVPAGATKAISAEGDSATVASDKFVKQVSIFYRTEDMLMPRLLFEESPKHPDEVAVMASLVPTFEPKQPQECKVTEAEEPVATPHGKPGDFLFVFVVDRSGSMHGMRIEVTKQALKLFIQSLPFGCKFDILSFGSSWESMAKQKKNKKYFEYTEANAELALNEIVSFDSEMGCTNLAEPMEYAAKTLAKEC